MTIQLLVQATFSTMFASFGYYLITNQVGGILSLTQPTDS